MNVFMRFISIYTAFRSVIFLVFIMLVLEILLVLSTVWSSSFQFIVDNHVFEIVVLFAIVQMILLVLKLLEQTPQNICDDEAECQALVKEFIRTNPRAARLHIFSAGLSSRYGFLSTINNELGRDFQIEILAQSPDHAPDKMDANRMRLSMDILKRDHPRIPVQIRTYITPATIRAYIVCDHKRKPLWGIVSWYLYELTPAQEIRVKGRENPAVVLSNKGTMEDISIMQFFMSFFERIWQENANNIVFPGK